MKTETRSKIVEIIDKNGSARPSDLAKQLNISTQALHRHLRKLVSEQFIERVGDPPYTRYVLAGNADFSSALKWYLAKRVKEAKAVCETRDIFVARLTSQFSTIRSSPIKEVDLPLVVSVAGEVGNNSFDHNLGHWKDQPGCWFEVQFFRNHLWVLVADRGRGIYRSLTHAVPTVSNDQAAIEIAFEKRISGRAPEQRGNGLVFVKNAFANIPKSGICCRSGNGVVQYGELGNRCFEILKTASLENEGTVTLMVWSSK